MSWLEVFGAPHETLNCPTSASLWSRDPYPRVRCEKAPRKEPLISSLPCLNPLRSFNEVVVFCSLSTYFP